MAPRRRCPVCQSKEWHKEPSSGLIACSEGHVLQSYRNEAAEADDLGQHTYRQRALKSGRKKKEQESKADPKQPSGPTCFTDVHYAYSLTCLSLVYHGDRARYHYLQCLQLLLRKQILALVSLWVLPAEFEILCRDIWALHLSLLPHLPPAEPYLHLLDTRGETRPMITKKASGLSQKSSSGGHTSQEDFAQDSSPESSDSSEEDPEMQELLRENSASGSSDEDVPESAQKLTATQKSVKRTSADRYDSPASNIAVLMLACWTMRIPVMYEDFRKIIELHQLPYMDPVRLFPDSLTVHLTKSMRQMLSPHRAPTTLLVHRLTSRLARLFYSTHGILTPEVNAAPILWRVIRSMGGTPVLYNLTKTLGRVLSLPLVLHHSLAPSLKRVKQRDPDSHKYDSVPPEVAFVAVSIIVLKMVYGLDGTSRIPVDSNDSACALPTLHEYLAFVKAVESAEMESQGEIFRSDTHMFVASSSVYWPWLTHNLISGVAKAREKMCVVSLDFPMKIGQLQAVRNILDDYFPLGNRATALPMSVGQLPYPQLSANEASNEDATPVLRPGQVYTIYNPQDVLGSMPDQYEAILSRAARHVGVGADYLSGVIEKYERRFVRWWDSEKRKSLEIEGEEAE